MSISQSAVSNPISTHAPAGGATGQRRDAVVGKIDFYSRPCGRGDRSTAIIRSRCTYFYSRPCGRGDAQTAGVSAVSTYFYSRPCGRGDGRILLRIGKLENFYSRPCGRGDNKCTCSRPDFLYFYSRPCGRGDAGQSWRNLYATRISTHAPAGGATKSRMLSLPSASNFYSRPCGRGDQLFWRLQIVLHRFLLTPLREGRQDEIAGLRCGFIISTHAPAGGATHKCLKS